MLLRILGIGLAVLLVSMLIAWFFGQRLSGAIAKLTDVAREISLGKGLNEKIEATSRTDEVGQLARAVERLQTSVKIMMKRMQKK